ncbi:MAG: response regulator transcription factor [Saprospiraceae bacterium]|nr:response regulator transcription factor [Saprospiraceae bacterium]
MNKVKAIIVEDEFHSREALKNLVAEYCPDIEVLGLAANIDEGLTLLEDINPDLVFLDIEMPNESGFDLLTKAKKLNFEVIFTTAYRHYALKAIKFSAIDYILKPIDLEELQSAVDKVMKKRRDMWDNKKIENLLSNIHNKNVNQHSITLSTSEGYEFIKVSQIIYCEANGAYTKFYLKERKPLLVSRHLKEYENLLNDHHFMRVHQSYLVNLMEVEKYLRSDGGYIVMKNGDKISISNRKKEQFIQAMASQHF